MDEIMFMEYLQSKGLGHMSEEEFMRKFKDFMSKYSRSTYIEENNYIEDIEDPRYIRTGRKPYYPDMDYEESKRRWDRYNRMVEEHSSIPHYGMRSFDTLQGDHFNESYAKYIVSQMHHDGHMGEHFSMEKAKEIKSMYHSKIHSNVTICDIYVAINAQYHDYCKLFKEWFGNNIDGKIIESAIVFWFQDEDYMKGNKIVEYFK